MKKTTQVTIRAAVAAILLMAGGVPARAASIPMPAGSRSWILVSGADCDDDGTANNDPAHCIGAVSDIPHGSDVGHDIFPSPYAVECAANITADGMRGIVGAGPSHLGVFLDMSMIDTYTVHSSQLPDGSVVPITVNFRALGTMYPINFFQNFYGGGAFEIHIGNTFNPNPFVTPENLRVPGLGTPGSSASFFINQAPSGTPIPLDLTTHLDLSVTLGTPFDVAYYLGARPAAAVIDFSHTASISFTLPPGATITSTGGFGEPVAVEQTTWSSVKNLFR